MYIQTYLYLLIAIDGEIDGHRSTGVRGTDLEVACAATTFSADPTDCHILMNKAATPLAVQTILCRPTEERAYKEFKKDFNLQREKKVNHLKIKKDEEDVEDDDDLDDNKTKVTVLPSDHLNMFLKGDDKDDNYFNLYSLTTCRVLHLSANKIQYLKDDLKKSQTESENEKKESGVHLPSLSKVNKMLKVDQLKSKKNKSSKKNTKSDNPNDFLYIEESADIRKDKFTSSDVVKQLYLKNCALTVLSRFGITDDIFDIKKTENNTQFLEAMHLAGANTILCPAWGPKGVGTLSNLLFLIRFYSILASKSKERCSIVEACRHAQLWLRSVTADDAIAFVQRAAMLVISILL